MRQPHTLVLSRPCGRYVEVFVRISTVGRIDSRDRPLCEGFRPPFHSKQRYSSEMASGADYERTENYVHASGAFSVPRQCYISTVRVTQAARSVLANGRQIVVPALLQYTGESQLCRENPGHNILRSRRDEC